LVVLGGTQISYLADKNTLLQATETEEHRGRVTSIYMLDHSLAPLGTLAAGVVAPSFGAPLATVILGACVVAITAAVVVRYPFVRRLT
jgi:hypothetical protein